MIDWSTRVVGVTPREEALGMSGLAFLRKLIAGELPAPPFSRTMRVWMTEAEEGRVVFEGTPEADFLNPLGSVHGGWVGAILDSAMACAVHTLLQPGQGYTSVEMKIHFTRAVLPTSGLLRCEGKVVHAGRQIATSEGYLRDERGRVLAHGTETCLIMDAKPATGSRAPGGT